MDSGGRAEAALLGRVQAGADRRVADDQRITQILDFAMTALPVDTLSTGPAESNGLSSPAGIARTCTSSGSPVPPG